MTEKNHRWIMHVDMDAFFASVEQRDTPEYRGRPVIVGARPGGRGVVATCSYEARRFGVRSAMPIAEAYARCPDAVYLTPDMARYSAASASVMALFDEISPLVEQVSVDEAYIDISGLERLYGSLRQIGELTREKIRQGVGLTCSVGIGPNRLLAKLASEYRKPDGLTLVRADQVRAFLDPMPVSNLRGVGPKTMQTVKRLGLENIGQLHRYSLEMLRQSFGEKGGQHLYNQARGIASDHVGETQQRRSISKETTFEQDVSDQERLRRRVRRLAAEVGRLTRKEGLLGQVVTFKLRLTGFETHTRQTRMSTPTDSDQILFKVAWELYLASGHQGRPVRLIGVGLSGWCDGVGVVGDLFQDVTENKIPPRLYRTLDQINDRFGRNKLTWGLESSKPSKDPDDQ